MSGASLDEAYIENVDSISASENLVFSNEMSWPINENTMSVSQNKSQSNVISQDLPEEEIPIVNMKKVMETFTSLKSQLKKNQTSMKINENAIKDVKECQENVNKVVGDVLRIFGRTKQSQELMYVTGAISNIVKEESEVEVNRLQSLQKEMLQEGQRFTEKIGECAKMLKECVKEMSEEERANFQNPALCGICVENSINYVFNPCGHTICQGCKTLSHGYNCHICRKYIKDCVKIYFS